jgi:hypothetical protein
MATLKRTIKQIIQTDKSLRLVRDLTQKKLDALLETNPLYKLFEPDTRHPYYVLAETGQNPLNAFEALIAGVLDWKIGSGSIKDELEEVADEDSQALILINPVVMTEAEAADQLLSALLSVASTRDKTRASVINRDLEELHGKKNIKRHKESPELEIAKDLTAAVREIKKLAKVLRDLGNGCSTIRRELEKKQVMRGLSGQGKDYWIDTLLK